MPKNLFLLCPTDSLEPIINNVFNDENYFYTSLGNSFVSDDKTLKKIKELVEKHTIKNICFVLSKDNQIILDALGRQLFSDVRGLKKFYKEIKQQKKHSEVWQYANSSRFSMLSYYLNNRIKELQIDLSGLHCHSIKVNGKIYDRYENVFKTIYSDLICTEKYLLN